MQRIIFLAIFLALMEYCLFSRECSGVESYDQSSYFISDAEPVPLEKPISNPLEYSTSRIGLDIDGFKLPRGHEGRYRFSCRFPVIDYVSERPLYMKQWTEEQADLLMSSHSEKGIEVVADALTILCGGKNETDVEPAELKKEKELFRDKLQASSFKSWYQDALLELYESYLKAWRLTKYGRRGLSEEDLSFFNKNPGYYIAPTEEKMTSLTGNVETHFRYIECARRADYACIFGGAEIVSKAVMAYIERVESHSSSDFCRGDASKSFRLEYESPAGLIKVSGKGNDEHNEDAVFLIDLGGDDVYVNNAGGVCNLKQAVCLCIDHAGDDDYISYKGRYMQGFGHLGTGMLIDLSGDDRYMAGHFSQAAGIMGVGVIWDKEGDDQYIGQTFGQGAGMFGLGMLLDDAGEDFYDIASLGQGAATTLGLGILSDLTDDDRYHLAVGRDKDSLGGMPGYGQGGALSFRHYPWEGELTPYGGAGMLIDARGNDRYRTKGWCDQGGSYIMSLGALVDYEGNDHYSAHTGQGSGIHITNAILVDRKGHDVYEGKFRCGGSGGDRSPGFLIDYQGNDVYRSRTSSYGTGCKPFCFSLFVDYSGDDVYICPRPEDEITFNNWESFGGVWPESEPHIWPYAVCLDLSGDDDYQVRNRSNNSETHSFGHGIHLDTEFPSSDIIGTLPCPLEPYRSFPLPLNVKNSEYYEDIKALQNPHTFIRFQTIGRITNSGTDVLPSLVDAVINSEHVQFNRDVLECIHIFCSSRIISENDEKTIAKLLKAASPEIRIITADNCGIWKWTSSEHALMESLKDENAEVRRFALNSLISLESDKASSFVRESLIKDSSENVRRTAVRYIQLISEEFDPFPYLADALLDDPASSVRVAAAEALGYLQEQRAVELLKDAAESYDVYLKRAAAKSLGELGEIEGIEILIDSLSFPSIDAFFNYDRNIPNYISAYAGHDLNEDERYDREKWRQWFQKSKDQIDLKENVKAYRAYQDTAKAVRDITIKRKIEKYEAFLSNFPDYNRARKALAKILNEAAWKMVTAPENSKDHDPETGLKYALRAVELEPHINYIDTLAEAYLAAGKTAEAEELCLEMLEKHPDEKMFQDRLDRCRKTSENDL